MDLDTKHERLLLASEEAGIGWANRLRMMSQHERVHEGPKISKSFGRYAERFRPVRVWHVGPCDTHFCPVMN